MATSATPPRSLVALHLPDPVSDLIKTADSIILAMTGNAFFPTPTPSIATLTAAVTTLNTAETATKTRAAGTVAARNTAKTALLSGLHAVKAYVQTVADANPAQAEAIITSAGMAVRKDSSRDKAPFSAAPGATTGTVDLAAKSAGARSAYEWQYSLDGKTWISVGTTLQAKTTIPGLPAGTTVQFRYRPVTKTGEQDWSQPISLLVQ